MYFCLFFSATAASFDIIWNFTSLKQAVTAPMPNAQQDIVQKLTSQISIFLPTYSTGI